jgi:NRPS condensation-like uncharacterized protein
MARVRGTLSPDSCQSALDKLLIKHPALSINVVQDTEGEVYLVSNPTLKIPVRLEERTHPKHWIEEMTTELTQAFDLSKDPPIRCVLLQDKDVLDILFICPHVLADGFATVYLLRDFLAFLNDPEAKVTPTSPVQPMNTLIPDFPGKGLTILQANIKAQLLKLSLSHAPHNPSQTISPHPVRPNYHLRPWTLTSEQTAALVTRSRAEGTTVHAALCTAFLRAFGEFHEGDWNRKIQSPVSLRDRLTQPVGEAFGLFVNLVAFPINCDPDDGFWEVARSVKKQFIRRTADRQVFKSLIEANVVTRQVREMLTPSIAARVFMKADHDLSISNLGRVDIPMQYGSFQLEALFGPILGGDPEDVVLGVVTIGGKMHLSLSFTDLNMDAAQAEKIIEAAMQWLVNATQEWQEARLLPGGQG